MTHIFIKSMINLFFHYLQSFRIDEKWSVEITGNRLVNVFDGHQIKIKFLKSKHRFSKQFISGGTPKLAINDILIHLFEFPMSI